MACIRQQERESTPLPQFPETASPSFSRTRRPALILPNASFSLAEAEDLVRPRIHQPLFPPPDPRLLRDIRPVSPEQLDTSMIDAPGTPTGTHSSRESSPTSNYNHLIDSSSIPPALARDPRRRAAWLKARAQYARDKGLHQCPVTEKMDTSPEPEPKVQRIGSGDFGPKRKHSAFVKEQELKCLIEDRVGTPHISELQPDDDVSPQLDVEELSMSGKVTALGDGSVMTENSLSGSLTSPPSRPGNFNDS